MEYLSYVAHYRKNEDGERELMRVTVRGSGILIENAKKGDPLTSEMRRRASIGKDILLNVVPDGEVMKPDNPDLIRLQGRNQRNSQQAALLLNTKHSEVFGGRSFIICAYFYSVQKKNKLLEAL